MLRPVAFWSSDGWCFLCSLLLISGDFEGPEGEKVDRLVVKQLRFAPLFCGVKGKSRDGMRGRGRETETERERRG